nr:MAG TPA: hypothetical protein [Caudoviricetes sp.]
MYLYLRNDIIRTVKENNQHRKGDINHEKIHSRKNE